jgi:hypothetical protein
LFVVISNEFVIIDVPILVDAGSGRGRLLFAGMERKPRAKSPSIGKLSPSSLLQRGKKEARLRSWDAGCIGGKKERLLANCRSDTRQQPLSVCS